MNEKRRYRVLITKQPEKALRKLPRNLVARLVRAIDALAETPFPPNCKKLTGYDNLYRLRVGDWRISYAVENDQLVIVVLEIAARGSAYRNL